MIPFLPLRGLFPPPLPHMAGVAIPPRPSLPLPHLFNTSSTTVTSHGFDYLSPVDMYRQDHLLLLIIIMIAGIRTILTMSSHFERFGIIINLTLILL